MNKTGFKDTDGIDIGYRFVRKKEIGKEKDISGPKRSLGGTLWTWGCELHGQLGRNCNSFSSLYSPVQTIAGGNNWKQACAASTFSAAVKTDGTLWTWGSNCCGLLGDNTSTSKSSPIQTIAGGTNWKNVQAVGIHAMALKTDGTLWSWGQSVSGTTANGNCLDKSSPTQVGAGGAAWTKFCMAYRGGGAGVRTDGSFWWWGYTFVSQPTCIPFRNTLAGYYWKDVAVGHSTIAAIKTDGTLWSLGCCTGRANPYSQAAFLSSPVQEFFCSNDWKKVFSYREFTGSVFLFACNSQTGFLALKCDGTLWGWAGRNCNVLIPDCTISALDCTNSISTTPKIFKPVLNITGCTKWKEVATNSISGVGIKEDGTLWGWGRSRPVRVLSPATSNECFFRCPVQLTPDKQSWKTISISCGNIIGVLGD